MNVTDPGTRVPRKLVLIAASLVAAGIAGAALLAATVWAPASPRSNASVTGLAGPPAASAPAVKLKPRAGRVLSVADAMKELDLIRPSRQTFAEDFTLPLVGGKDFRLADRRGKVVMINFWATWCLPCLEEMPAMERLWQHHRDQNFVLVAVSMDANPKLVKPFVDRHGLTFPIALDPKLDLGNAYGVRALPSSFIVDRDGYVAALALGPRPWDTDASHSLVEGLVTR
jgi:peroxiredoxin